MYVSNLMKASLGQNCKFCNNSSLFFSLKKAKQRKHNNISLLSEALLRSNPLSRSRSRLFQSLSRLQAGSLLMGQGWALSFQEVIFYSLQINRFITFSLALSSFSNAFLQHFPPWLFVINVSEKHVCKASS